MSYTPLSDIFDSPPRSYISDTECSDIEIIDDTIMEECVEWITQFAIYNSFEYHQIKRNLSIQTKAVKTWATLQTSRVCTQIEMRFKKKFAEILPIYLNSSIGRKHYILENITNRAEERLNTFNVKVPDFFLQKITGFVNDLVYKTPNQNTTLKRRHIDSRQEIQRSVQSIATPLVSKTFSTTIVNNVSRPFTPQSIDSVATSFTYQSMDFARTASTPECIDFVRTSYTPQSIVEMQRSITPQSIETTLTPLQSIDAPTLDIESIITDDIKEFLPLISNNNNNSGIFNLLELIEISDDEDCDEDRTISVQTTVSAVSIQTTDEILNGFLEGRLEQLVNNLVPDLVNKRFDEEIYKKQTQVNSIMEAAFQDENNNYVCSFCSADAIMFCIECHDTCYCSDKCKSSDKTHICQEGLYVQKNITYPD